MPCLLSMLCMLHRRLTQEELLAIDLEGRCVITDHETFILFNLYGPAITSEESAADRFAYKMQLYQVSSCLQFSAWSWQSSVHTAVLYLPLRLPFFPCRHRQPLLHHVKPG